MNTDLVLRLPDLIEDTSPPPPTTLPEIWGVTPAAMMAHWSKLRDRWLNMHQEKSQATYKSYQTASQQWIDWLTSRDLYPWEVVSEHVRSWQAWMIASGSAASTVNHRLSAVSSWYEFVIKESHMINGIERCLFIDASGQTRNNPFKVGNISRPKVTQYGKAHPLSDHQVNQLVTSLQERMNTVTGARNYALVISHLLTASRGSEIVRLRWKDIRPNRSQPGGLVFAWSGKRDKHESTPFPTFAYDAIINYLKVSGRWLPGHPDDIQDDDYIFIPIVTHGIANLTNVNPDKFDAEKPAARHLSPKSAQRIFQSSLRQAGIEDWAKYRLHDAKHTLCHVHHDIFKDIEATRQLAHHENIATTGIYIRNMTDPIDDYSLAVLARWGLI